MSILVMRQRDIKKLFVGQHKKCGVSKKLYIKEKLFYFSSFSLNFDAAILPSSTESGNSFFIIVKCHLYDTIILFIQI